MNKILQNVLLTLRKLPLLIEKQFDHIFLSPDVPVPKITTYENWRNHLSEIGNQPGKKILEIGSREVTGISQARERFAQAEYIGFDFYPGRNVDLVGDAHKLSSYFDKDTKFDIIYSSACFEHFALPWVVSTEIAKMLKLGGLVFIETHFSFSSHERPWHFFQFSDLGLRMLFPQALGIKCIDAGMSNPMVGRFSVYAEKSLRGRPIKGLYCHSQFFGEKIRQVDDFDWNKLELTDMVGNTSYPKPQTQNLA